MDLVEMSKEDKTHINVAFIGSVDSGKSTLGGHILYRLGEVTEEKIRKLEKEGIELGRYGHMYKYPWVLDNIKAERERGITINTKYRKFEGPTHTFTLIDTPGHQDYIKNMISAVSQADAAVVVVSASFGEFEASFSIENTLRQHLLIAYTFGVRQLIICINKMDVEVEKCRFSEVRFQEIKDVLSEYLIKVGYNPKSIPFIPITSYYGDNLFTLSNEMKWYKGPTVIRAIDILNVPKRLVDKPLRIPVLDVKNIKGIGTVVMGIVASGVLKVGSTVAIAPGVDKSSKAMVKSIETYYEARNCVYPGDNAALFCLHVCVEDFQRGSIVSDSRCVPIAETESFFASIIVLNSASIIEEGYTPIIFCHTARVPCKFLSIHHRIDRSTGKSIEENPKTIKNGDTALVTLVPMVPFCCEEYSEYPSLGSFVVRDLKKVIAIGIIKKVNRKF